MPFYFLLITFMHPINILHTRKGFFLCPQKCTFIGRILTLKKFPQKTFERPFSLHLKGNVPLPSFQTLLKSQILLVNSDK